LTVLKNPSRILEVGFGAGYSAAWMQYAAPKADLVSLEKDPARFEQGRELMKKFQFTVDLKNEDAREFLKNNEEKWDMVFLDGVKSQYLDYIRLLKHHLNPGALIIADNILYRGKVLEESLSRRLAKEVQKLREFCRYLEESDCFQTVFLPASDGLSISIYKEH
jgi:predicted O-methyltransferase YrrM